MLDYEIDDIKNKQTKPEKSYIPKELSDIAYQLINKQNLKGNIQFKEELLSQDKWVSFLKSYEYLKTDYICVLHPLSYLIKKSNFDNLDSFKNNYKLLDGVIVSSEMLNNTSMLTPFPIIVALYQRNSEGMAHEDIKKFVFKVYNTNYKFSLNQFLYVEDLHTKYKDKGVSGNYKHFSMVRDMNQLTVSGGFLDKEDSQSIRVKGTTALKIFTYLEYLKKWFVKNNKELYFLGDLSPIINKEIWKKVKYGDFINKNIEKHIDSFIRKELTKQDLTLIDKGNSLIWNFTNISPTSKNRFKGRKDEVDEGKVKPSASKKINENDFLEVQISYDKTIDDFYNKHSLYNLPFANNKNERKYTFELSDIVQWGFVNKLISFDDLNNLIINVKSTNTYLEDTYYIKRELKNNDSDLFGSDFKKVDIIKPSFIYKSKTNDYIEIQVDYKQKASGVQGMLFLNLSAKNLMINGESIVGKTIKKKDIIQYIISKENYNLFIKTILIFSKLSKNHNADILEILLSIKNKYYS